MLDPAFLRRFRGLETNFHRDFLAFLRFAECLDFPRRCALLRAGERQSEGLRGAAGQNILQLDRPLAIPVHTYGILVASGFLVAMFLAARAAERSGLNREKVLDLSFGILIAAMIGSRLLFIIVNWDEYAHDLLGIFQFWKGGLVFYGGFIGAVLFSVWYMRRHDMPFLQYADAMGPTVAIGQALGRLGCFSAGCCWSASSSRWATAKQPAGNAPLHWLKSMDSIFPRRTIT